MGGEAVVPGSQAASLTSQRTWIQRFPVYFGWVQVLIAAVAMTATLPGRTHGLGLFTEALLQDLQFDRVSFANINLAATLLGASFAVAAGWFIDRRGVRTAAVLVGLALAASVFALTQATSLPQFLIGLTLIRGFGQSALSVVSMAIIGKWFVRRLGIAMATFSVLLTIGFIVTVLSIGSAVQIQAGPVHGNPPTYSHPEAWRNVWQSIGWWLFLGFVPLAWLFVRNTPESCGLVPDATEHEAEASLADYTLAKALKTPAFWIFVLTTSLFNLIWSGVTLFNESILAEKGFHPEAAIQVLSILTGVGMLTNFVAGACVKRHRTGYILATGMGLLAVSLGYYPCLSTVGHLQLYAVGLGIAGGIVTVVFFAVWGELFGRRHLGGIQGAAQVIATLASAIGPLLLALSKDQFASYSPAILSLAGITGLFALACALVPLPPISQVE